MNTFKSLFLSKIFLSISLLLTILNIYLVGCIPAAIIAVGYSSAKTVEQRRKFIENFHTTTILRHEAGLPPLDLCTEKYKFDKYWARQDPECKEKIKEFNEGETTYTSREAEQLQEVMEKK